MTDEAEDLNAIFIDKDWIKAGKVYNSTLPSYVFLERSERMTVPDTFKATRTTIFPPPAIPITNFLAWKLPRQSSEIIASRASLWFSTDKPTTDVSVLQTRAVPPTDFIKMLEEAGGQAWLDGANSVVDHRYNNGTDRLPLWTVSFWKEIAGLHNLQAGWKRAVSWLQREMVRQADAQSKEVIVNATKLLDSLPWKTSTSYGHGMTDTFLLSWFLGTAWLSDEHIDIMMKELDAETTYTTPKTRIATLSFSNEIKKQFGDKKSSANVRVRNIKNLLYRYEQDVHENRVEKLAFPIHVNENHWIAGLINFRERTLIFGE
jgi:hypothetical protein